MKPVLRNMLWLFLAVICVTASLAAADTVIKGVVTDDAGKPVRGAVVRVSAGIKTVSRYTQANGRYEIAVPAGRYEVAASTLGFSVKRTTVDTTQPGDTNFTLSPRWDVTRLTGAEIEQLIPNDAPGKMLKGGCTSCHDLSTLLKRRGQTVAEWKSFLPTMTNGRRDQPNLSPAMLDALSAALAKYFGPDAQYFGPDADPPTKEQVKVPQLSDEVLKATFSEWTVPTGANAFPHSIAIDNKRGIAWFGEVGNYGLDPANCALFTENGTAPGADCGANHIGRFDVKTEQITEFRAPHPHTGAIAKDGRVYFAEAMRNDTSPNLAMIDPVTNQITYYKFHTTSLHGTHLHTPIVDHTGNVWLSGGMGEVIRFDVETHEFKSYKFPLPAKYPENAAAFWEQAPGEPERTPRGMTYHVSEDSKGGIWASLSDMGMLVRVDPTTGETKEYSTNATNARGLVVDHNDNVWFAAYLDHKIGKLDPKTGAIKMYQPPTLGGAPYGIIEEKRTGYIWYADQTGDNITRFDPKTEKFVEYPLPNPTHPSTPRFIDVDDQGRIFFTEYWSGRIGILDTGEGSKLQATR